MSKPDDRMAKSHPRREERERMVHEQMALRGVRDVRVLAALRKVPRHEFVPELQRHLAYEDQPLPIGHGQTISQPFMVAVMTELARLTPESVVLEIGAGCGYQTALLAELAKQVYSIEIVPELARGAAETLKDLGYGNIEIRAGDGYSGWPEHAPYDVIVLTAAPPKVPKPLLEQLRMGGRLVAPEGGEVQVLRVYKRDASKFEMKEAMGVRFVPMVGEAMKPPV